jgi:hypothetical protein
MPFERNRNIYRDLGVGLTGRRPSWELMSGPAMMCLPTVDRWLPGRLN